MITCYYYVYLHCKGSHMKLHVLSIRDCNKNLPILCSLIPVIILIDPKMILKRVITP